MTSILPGELVQCLITSVSPLGLNVQVLGYFDGTMDEYHLPPGDPTDNFKAGKKVKARVLYEIPGTSPPHFALSLASHVISLEQKSISAEGDEEVTSMEEAYPIGTTLDAVKVVRVEAERGLLVDVQEGVQGFVHVSIPMYIPCDYLKPPRFLTPPMNTSLRYPLLRERGKLVLRIVPGSPGTILLMASFNFLCALRSWNRNSSGSLMFKSEKYSRAPSKSSLTTLCSCPSLATWMASSSPITMRISD